MTEPRVYDSINRFRAALAKAEQGSAERLVTAYAGIFQKLQTDIRALEADIADLGERASVGKVKRLERYRELLAQTAQEMDKYAVVLENETRLLRQKAIEDALAHNKALVQAALPNLPQPVAAKILSSFNRLNPAAIESLLGSLQKGSPLANLLNTFGRDAAVQIGDAILQGVALGYNPYKVAQRITSLMGGNLTRALTIARTEQLRAYRTANIANYAANSDVVKGWRWSATKDNVCCLACLALDGQEFALSESFMPSHPNCRCAPTPVTVSYKDMGLDVPDLPMRETARDWFGGLPESEQREFFSAAGWRAYQDGAVTLDDFIGERESKDWGKAYVEKSLTEILGDGASKYYA